MKGHLWHDLCLKGTFTNVTCSMLSLYVFRLSSFVGSPPVPDIPKGFPGGHFLPTQCASPGSLCPSFWSSALCLPSPLRPAPADLMLVSSLLPPCVPRTKAQVCGRCSSSSGLMVSDNSTGWKTASHSRSRSASSECVGHSPLPGMSPRRCASVVPTLPPTVVFTFQPSLSGQLSLHSCPFRVPGAPQCPVPQQPRSPHVSPASSGLLPLSLPLRLCAGASSLPNPRGPSRDGSLSKRAITPRGELLPRGRRQRRLQST